MQFLKGHIEDIPLPDATVDVVISNCVINLAADKGQVLREAYRVLKPGGRFAVSDVVAQGALPDDLRADMEAWVGCVAGALEEDEYRRSWPTPVSATSTSRSPASTTPRTSPRAPAGVCFLLRQRLLRQRRRVGSLRLRPLRSLWRPPGQRLRPGAETVRISGGDSLAGTGNARAHPVIGRPWCIPIAV